MLDMCSSDLKIPTFFLCLQIHLPRWCFTQDIYSKSCLVHVYLGFLLQKVQKGEFTALKYKCQLEGSQRCLLSYGTYFMLLYLFTGSVSGVVCFISWCGWLSTALRVCKGHKRVQEPKGLLSSWELQASPSSKFSHSLFCHLKDPRWDGSNWGPLMWCPERSLQTGEKVKQGQTDVSWDVCLLCFAAKECVFNAWRRGDIPHALRQRTSLSPLPPILLSCFCTPWYSG